MMIDTHYAEPLGRLLALNRPKPWDLWADYPSMGIQPQHVPELIRMATDPALLDGAEEDPAVWAPLHAWRALGQLRAVDAIEPLLTLLPRIDTHEDDAISSDLPIVFGMIGLPALEPLARYAADPQHPTYARIAAAKGIERIGLADPAHRAAAAAALAGLLDRSTVKDLAINGFLVGNLCDLHARQHIDTIERAYADRRVDKTICGTLADIRAEFGLAPPAVRRRPFIGDEIDEAIGRVLPSRPDPSTPDWMKEFLA